MEGAPLRGADIVFAVGNVTYRGTVTGNTMSGTMSGGRTGSWTATNANPSATCTRNP